MPLHRRCKVIPQDIKKYVALLHLPQVRYSSSELKKIVKNKISTERNLVRDFRKAHGNHKMGEVTINMMYGGMRGVNGLVYETSTLHPKNGIRFRGLSIPECQKALPKAPGGEEPIPEGLFWLLITGDIPTQEQVESLSKELAARSKLPSYIRSLIQNLPRSMHPMAQYSTAITALSKESRFADAYSKGLKKLDYWDPTYEDALDLIAKLPHLAAMIYRNTFKDGKLTANIEPCKDWALNFTELLGYNKEEFTELMRLYLTIHADHEGGNASAHSVRLVGSTLSNPYLAYAGGMNALAGPLHGLANQEVLIWLLQIQEKYGCEPSKEELREFCLKTLKEGRTIPGYGHAVMRAVDPRYTCQREFALKHLPDDPMFLIVSKLFEVVPPVLEDLGKVSNPWPNVDAHSGVLLYHYGMKEMKFYTVLFGLSRALGTMASIVWDRALLLPIERPKSFSTRALMELVGYKQGSKRAKTG